MIPAYCAAHIAGLPLLVCMPTAAGYCRASGKGSRRRCQQLSAASEPDMGASLGSHSRGLRRVFFVGDESCAIGLCGGDEARGR